MTSHTISPAPLRIADIEHILASGAKLELGSEARGRVQRCRDYLDQKSASSSRPIYGVTTGFGSLCSISISADKLSELQRNLVMSHACSVGPRVDSRVVRVMMIAKAHALALGYSGVAVETVQRILDLYNAGIIPVVRSLGSLGASGDLAPLANMSLPLLGIGEVEYKGRAIPAAEALEAEGLSPITLKSKEGLALLNGTQFMSAHAAVAVMLARKAAHWADKIAALSLDAFDGIIDAFDPDIQRVRPHAGQAAVAEAVRGYLAGSQIIAQPKSHVQDPYSFRCVPQVHGASRQALDYVTGIIETEINSVTDNPTIFPDQDKVISGGNFHGEPIAQPMDYLCIALTELANISERRVYQLVSGRRGLPSFLVAEPGVNSGFMIPQYVAASIVNRCKTLCWPSSCDSIPSSQGQEDHVSMGSNSATKLCEVAGNALSVLGIELLNAAQALEFRRPLRTSPVLEELVADFRRVVPFVETDTVMYPLIDKAKEYILQH